MEGGGRLFHLLTSFPLDKDPEVRLWDHMADLFAELEVLSCCLPYKLHCSHVFTVHMGFLPCVSSQRSCLILVMTAAPTGARRRLAVLLSSINVPRWGMNLRARWWLACLSWNHAVDRDSKAKKRPVCSLLYLVVFLMSFDSINLRLAMCSLVQCSSWKQEESRVKWDEYQC